MAVKFGLFVPQGWKMDLRDIADPLEQYEAMARVALAAEEAGYDSVWVYDHFHTVPVPSDETTFEAWTVTAGLLRDTKRIRVGQMTTCNGYRNPALLAKMASTVDAMSNGRVICGLGAGWSENEWRAYGFGFPDLATRMGMFREACEIMSRMWHEEKPAFTGKYYNIDSPINLPKGAHGKPPAFWIAGEGEKVTLRLVARFADGCNIRGGDPDDIRQKLAVLHRHCEAVGRDPSEIAVSTNYENVYLLAPGEDPDKVVDWRSGQYIQERHRRSFKVLTADELSVNIELMIGAGADYIILYLAGLAYSHDMLYRFASDVMPRFA